MLSAVWKGNTFSISLNTVLILKKQTVYALKHKYQLKWGGAGAGWLRGGMRVRCEPWWGLGRQMCDESEGWTSAPWRWRPGKVSQAGQVPGTKRRPASPCEWSPPPGTGWRASWGSEEGRTAYCSTHCLPHWRTWCCCCYCCCCCYHRCRCYHRRC